MARRFTALGGPPQMAPVEIEFGEGVWRDEVGVDSGRKLSVG